MATAPAMLSGLFGCAPRMPRRGAAVCSRRRLMPVRAARMEAQRLRLGTKAADFSLVEPLTGKVWTLSDFRQQPALLVMFICNHCPFVIHLKPEIVKLTGEFMTRGLGVAAISSNSVKTHPQDGPEAMAADAKRYGYRFPYLYDETQDVARAYTAVCTPDFFLFTKMKEENEFELCYHGQFDDSRPGNDVPVTGRDLRAAIECALARKPVEILQKPSLGCSIKWHP